MIKLPELGMTSATPKGSAYQLVRRDPVATSCVHYILRPPVSLRYAPGRKAPDDGMQVRIRRFLPLLNFLFCTPAEIESATFTSNGAVKIAKNSRRDHHLCHHRGTVEYDCPPGCEHGSAEYDYGYAGTAVREYYA